MPVICLVRHGQASFGADEYDVLSDVGHQQARIVGVELARRGLRRPLLVSGSLRRQRDTAAAVAAVTGWGPIESDARWDEYDHVAMLAGAVPADNVSMQALLDVALTAWIEGGSPGWPAFSSAGADALASLCGRLDSGQDAVVVTSGGVIASLCATLVGSPAAPTVVAFNRVAVNTAVTTLIVGRGGTNLSAFNDHSHLFGEHRSLLTYR